MSSIVGTIMFFVMVYVFCVRIAIELVHYHVDKQYDSGGLQSHRSLFPEQDNRYDKLWIRISYIFGPITVLVAIMRVLPRIMKYTVIQFGILMRNTYNWIMHGKFGSMNKKPEITNNQALAAQTVLATTVTNVQQGRTGQWHVASRVQKKQRNGDTNMTIDYATRTYRLLEGLALGDSIGVTTEFFSGSGRVISVYDKFHRFGWPFVSVGKKKWNLKPGDHTDDTDMACCIVQSVYDEVGNEMDLAGHRVNPVSISEYFVRWLNTNPKDIGNTTHSVLCKLRDGVAWNDAGYEVWETNKNGDA